MVRHLFPILCCILLAPAIKAQEERLRLDVPILDIPQNLELPHRYPSMEQASAWSTDLYQLGFWGIDAGVDGLLSGGGDRGRGGRLLNGGLKYLTGLAFARYGSELPIPLGVWAHEEFHRAVLGVNAIASLNGNWIGGRWDGTVYGITDEQLSLLKADRPDALLYSYVAGVHAEVLSTERVTLEAFRHRRSVSMAPLLLYNSWYVWDYLRFATSAASDSVKVLAPPHESTDPAQRDFAGNDLTAWAYDLFLPDQAYTDRPAFPNGAGVNRRIGFSDLPDEAKEFLEAQRALAWMNFANPGILGIDRIRITEGTSFSLFLQYAPTHFGHLRAIHLPVEVSGRQFRIALQEFVGSGTKGHGLCLDRTGIQLRQGRSLDVSLSVWDQPKSFRGTERNQGGMAKARLLWPIGGNLDLTLTAQYKTKGWLAGDPYLDANLSLRTGLQYVLR